MEPRWICISCGNKYGTVKEGKSATFHESICDVCNKKAVVTGGRAYRPYKATILPYLKKGRT